MGSAFWGDKTDDANSCEEFELSMKKAKKIKLKLSIKEFFGIKKKSENKYELLWKELYDFMNNHALAIHPGDRYKGDEKIKRQAKHDLLRDLLEMMSYMEKRKSTNE